MSKRKPKLGQNFLVDAGASLRIVESLGEERDRTVVEIGPGHGAITAHLASRCARLHCIEFDPALARELRFKFREQPHVTVHHADILQTDLRKLVSEGDAHGTHFDVVGNLPYYITSEILLHLFAAAREGGLRRAILMVQREVAERVTAGPGTSEYGALSALTQLHGQASDLFTLPPQAFAPPPDVYSTVFRFEVALRFEELGITFETFNPFLRAGFAQKRKTLTNNLRHAGFSAAQLAAAWPAELPPQVRAEAVPIEALAALYKSLDPLAAAG